MEKMLFKKGEESKCMQVWGISRIYGKIELLFPRVENLRSCARRAKRMADLYGYDIYQVLWHREFNEPAKDVTAEFLEA